MKTSGQFSAKRYLGFDFGTKSIGVAVGQSITQSAQPLQAIKAREGIPNWSEVAHLVEHWQPDAFVIGIPYTMEGEEGEMAKCARKFARRLTGRYHKPSYEMDERLSSYEANEQLERSAASASISVDSMAASLILESWFRMELADSQPRP